MSPERPRIGRYFPLLIASHDVGIEAGVACDLPEDGNIADIGAVRKVRGEERPADLPITLIP